MTVGTLVSEPTEARNTLGALGSITRLKLSLWPPGVRRISVTSPIAWYGIWAFTWLGETYSIGTGRPFTLRQLLASAVGSGISEVVMLTGLNWFPKTEIRPPGAISFPMLPAFTTDVML